jgi:hypothetical protein
LDRDNLRYPNVAFVGAWRRRLDVQLFVTNPTCDSDAVFPESVFGKKFELF